MGSKGATKLQNIIILFFGFSYYREALFFYLGVYLFTAYKQKSLISDVFL